MKHKKMLSFLFVTVAVVGIAWLRVSQAQQETIDEGQALSELAAQQETADLAKKWKTYLQNFRTVEMMWTTSYEPVQVDAEQSKDATDNVKPLQGTSKTVFHMDGAAYRTELWDLGSTTVEPQVISAFNMGTFYQLSGKSILKMVGTPKHSPYERKPPFFDLFTFALDNEHKRSATIATLQGEGIWHKFLKTIKEVKKESRGGKPGTLLNVDNPDFPVTFQVWVDDTVGLPTQWVTTDKETGTVIATGAVTRFFLWKNAKNSLFIPVETVAEVTRPGRKTRITTVVDTKNLKINQPISVDNLMIPPGRALFEIDHSGKSKQLDLPDPAVLPH